ncbi:MAG: hypothetical protein N4A33_08400 [Bacteriovoracaceae bacterium]|jgi:hypothetical protein|nr:hypothetical protein [Bacteriovoracaceae bacterium]
MKNIIIVVILLSTASAFARTIKWSSLYANKSYKLTQKVELSDRSQDYTIEASTVLKLIESTPLPMINVQLFKFIVPDCPSTSMKTELELLEVPQQNQSPVVIGYNLDKNCTLEIFIEHKDFYSYSIFK